MSVKLNVIDREGSKSTIEVEEGTSIKDAIMNNFTLVEFGLCGGNCFCGTCHVFVDTSDYKKLQAITEGETETLEGSAIPPTKYSRLGCQIELTKELDNLTVTIAPVSTLN